MSAFIITVSVIFILSTGTSLAQEPNKPRKGYSGSVYAISAILECSIGAWGLWLLVKGGAA